jgi:hypothetical protein
MSGGRPYVDLSVEVMVLRQGRVLAAAAIALALAEGATGCGKSADAKARDAFKSAVRDVGPHSRSIPEYCRKHIAMSNGDCLDLFANAAAYCPWPDDNMPTILKSWSAGGGRTLLRIKGTYRDGTTYTHDVAVVKHQGHLRLAHPYWYPCPSLVSGR